MLSTKFQILNNIILPIVILTFCFRTLVRFFPFAFGSGSE